MICPGTGKAHTLLHKIKEFLDDKNIPSLETKNIIEKLLLNKSDLFLSLIEHNCFVTSGMMPKNRKNK